MALSRQTPLTATFRPKVHQSLNKCDFVVGMQVFTMIAEEVGHLVSTCGYLSVVWPKGQTQPDVVALNGAVIHNWSVVTRGRRTRGRFAAM